MKTEREICEVALELALKEFGSTQIIYDPSSDKKMGSELKNDDGKFVVATQDGVNLTQIDKENIERVIKILVSNIKEDKKSSEKLITAKLSYGTSLMKNGLVLRVWKESAKLVRIDILYGWL